MDRFGKKVLCAKDGGNATAPRSNEETADIYLYAGSIRN